MARTGRREVTDEIRDRVVTGLHVGSMKGGERLPSVRTFAEEFGVNERVVLAALQTLADEGLLELRPRSGAYVVPPHPTAGAALPHLGAWLVSMLLQARSRGLPPREVSEYVRRCLETRRLRAVCVECNVDQLHLLCSELSDDHGYATEPLELDELRASEPPLAAQRADLLVTTVFHTDRVRALARRLGKPCIAVALRPDVMRNVAQRLAHGPVYYIATDARYEKKLRRMLTPFGHTTNLRVLVIGRDDLEQIPSDAPTFVMSSAREQVRKHFANRGAPGQPIQPPRHFSDDAARELLTFMVRANMAAFAAGLA